MKPFIIIFAFSLIFTACTTAPTSADYSLPISVTASLKGREPFEMVLTEDECTVVFSEGHSLYGTKLSFRRSEGQATIGSFTREVDLNLFPAQKALITALRGFCDKEIPKTESKVETRYTIDKTSIIVYYDEDKRTVKSIETEENGRRFEFDIAQLQAYEIQSDGAG